MTEQDRTPDKFGPYRVLDRIGEGGMGVVYLATDSEQRPVAVKVLRPAVAGDPNARRRLAREVETMRRVRSPFVADVIDADVTVIRRTSSPGTCGAGRLSRSSPSAGRCAARSWPPWAAVLPPR